jgi:hypothetical protein
MLAAAIGGARVIWRLAKIGQKCDTAGAAAQD